MSVLSKLKDKILMSDCALPYNCYELGHTWSNSCTDASLSIAINVLKESLKMYSLLYFLTQIVLTRRFGYQNFKTTFKSIFRSTSFLSFNALFTLSLFCYSRHLAGKFYLPIVSHLPAMVSSFAALKIERENRRSALAFYCSNIAMETIIFGNLNVRNNIKRFNKKHNLPIPKELLEEQTFKNGFLSLIFSLSAINVDDFKKSIMCIVGVTSIIYLTKLNSEETRFKDSKRTAIEKLKAKKEHTDLACLVFKYLIGHDEFGDNCQEKSTESFNLKLNEFDKKEAKKVMAAMFSYSHRTSEHCLSKENAFDCIKNSFSCSARGAAIGFLCNFTLFFAMHLKNNRFRLNQSFWSLLTCKENFKFGFLLGSFNGFYKLVSCFLHRIEEKKSNWHSIVSSLAGILLPKVLFSKFIAEPNLNLIQYIFWKSVENWFWYFACAHQTRQETIRKKYVELIGKELINKKEVTDAGKDEKNDLMALELRERPIDKKLSTKQKQPVNINLNTENSDQLNDKINKLTINDTLQLKQLADKLTQIESKRNFSVFNYISSDNLVGLFYSMSVSQLFYVAVMQPQKLRNSYMKFLDRCTDNKLRLLNRDIIDFFGVNSSAGYLPYEPVLDFNFTSRKFQECVQIWTI